MLTYPAKEKSRFIIVCLNTCLTVTYITHNKLVYFWCTLFSFNSEVLYNFAGIKTNHRTSMLNFIKFLLLLFVLASSAQKGYCWWPGDNNHLAIWHSAQRRDENSSRSYPRSCHIYTATEYTNVPRNICDWI